ncbi:MAG: hypothetical protein WB771_04530, partial [Solirubrobacterales bacterium]
MTVRTTSRLALAACMLLAALALPSSASAARGLMTGFAGIDPYQASGPPERATWFGRTVGARA